MYNPLRELFSSHTHYQRPPDKPVSKPIIKSTVKKRDMSQHDSYLQAMTKMRNKGIYSNGVGVGK